MARKRQVSARDWAAMDDATKDAWCEENKVERAALEKALATGEAKAAPKGKKGRKRRQEDLPGVEGPGVGSEVIDDIEEAGDEFVDAGSARSKASERVKKAKKALLEQMHKHKLEKYRYQSGRLIQVKPKDETETVVVKDGKVTVQAEFTEGDEGGGEAED